MTFIMYTPKIRMITITCSNDILCLFILLERLTSANLYSDLCRYVQGTAYRITLLVKHDNNQI